MQTSDWISIGSAIVAVGACFWAYRSAHHAKRQADAAEGNLPPTFEIANPGLDGNVFARINMLNNSTMKMRINRIRTKCSDKGMYTMPRHAQGQGTYYLTPSWSRNMPDMVVHDSITISGRVLGGSPNCYFFDLLFSRKGPEHPSELMLTVEIRYRLGNSRKIHKWRGVERFQLP